jgi:DNA invertase Pin-like site-specific DNA recombinase
MLPAAGRSQPDRAMRRSLREGIDYLTPVGRMVAGIFASLAEYERERAAA